MTQFSSGYALGIVFVLIVAVIWAAASVLTQYIYSNLEFNAPFLVTYFATTLFSLYLPFWKGLVYFKVVEDPPWRLPENVESNKEVKLSGVGSTIETTNIIHGDMDEEYGSDHCLLNNSLSQNILALNDTKESIPKSVILENNLSEKTYLSNSIASDSLPYNTGPIVNMSNIEENPPEAVVPTPYGHVDAIKVALLVSPWWFLANFLYNYSLLLTSVGSSTIISNLSGSFTLIFASYLGLEPITRGKLLGIALCLGGAALIAYQDEDDGTKRSFIGDVVALLASASYGRYTTAIRQQVPDDNGISMQLLFGYIGLITAVSLAPVVVVMAITHTGHVADITGQIFGFLFLGALFNNVLSDYLWARSVVLTSPTIATVGLSFTIPLAILSDFLIHGIVPTAYSFSGAILVIFGFIAVTSYNNVVEYITSIIYPE